jgi:hypothetical protein
MPTRFTLVLSGALVIWAVSAPVAKPIKAKAGNTAVTAAPALPSASGASVAPAAPTEKEASKEKAKPALGDAFIAQNTLRIYLDKPASISVFNARGQLVFRQDSQRQMEALPLQGMPTGFLYLTLRAGQTELTKKLLYTGK